jgi:hypothetical protein
MEEAHNDNDLPNKPAKSGCCGGCGEVATSPKEAGHEASAKKNPPAPVEPAEESCCGD